MIRQTEKQCLLCKLELSVLAGIMSTPKPEVSQTSSSVFKVARSSTHLILIGRLRLLHHVFVGEGGHGGRVSGLLSSTGTVDL